MKEQLNYQTKKATATTTKKKNKNRQKARDQKIYNEITGYVVVYFFRHIRDNLIKENMGAFISDYAIASKIYTGYITTLCSLLAVHF